MQHRMAIGIGLAALLMAFGGVSEAGQQFKQTPAGLFLLKIRLAGQNGQLDIVPASGTTDMNLNLSFVGGDEYCAGGPTPPDAQNTDKIYKVKKLPAPASCAVAACP